MRKLMILGAIATMFAAFYPSYPYDGARAFISSPTERKKLKDKERQCVSQKLAACQVFCRQQYPSFVEGMANVPNKKQRRCDLTCGNQKNMARHKDDCKYHP